MKDYSHVGTEEKRDAIEKEMSSLLSRVYKTMDGDMGLTREVLGYVEDTIASLKTLFASPSKQEILGGEFNKDRIYVGSEIQKEKTSVPLYFELDLLIDVLEKRYMPKFTDKGPMIQMVQELGKLRDEAAALKFSSQFQPQEKLSEEAMDDIIKATGNFEIERQTKAGIRFLGIDPIYTHDHVTYRNGDYISEGMSSGSLGKKPLYEKDEKALAEAQFQYVDDLITVVGKYFVQDWNFISVKDSFLDKLVSLDIDKRIMERLRRIYELQERYHNLAVVSEKATAILEEIIAIEDELSKERQATEKHQKALDQARSRYQAKSSLWKFFHRKMNPDNLQMDAMTTEEIDNLYQGRKR